MSNKASVCNISVQPFRRLREARKELRLDLKDLTSVTQCPLSILAPVVMETAYTFPKIALAMRYRVCLHFGRIQ